MKKGRTKTQICEVTGDEFLLSAEQLSAYEFFDLPLPTVSPEERLRLQLSFRNDHKLFVRTCSMTDQRILSVFGPQAPFPVVSTEYWRSEQWNPLVYGRNFDSNQLFVEQLLALWWTVPRPAFISRGDVNSAAINLAFDLRNCSNLFNARSCNDSMYSVGLWHCERCVDCYGTRSCQMCYECIHCRSSKELYWSAFSSNCEKCWFVNNCTNCKFCLFCANLDGKEYHVFNKPVSPEEFSRILSGWELISRARVEQAKEEFGRFLADKPVPPLIEEETERVTGNYLYQCRDCDNSYECFNSSELIDCNQLNLASNCLDGLGFGDGLEDSAQFVSVGSKGRAIVNCVDCWNNVSDLTYCSFCENSHHLFACVGMRNKEYCIFNKQYSREDYLQKRASIITFLKQRSIWGKFFPAQFSGHAYNYSSASVFMPLNHVSAKMMGYRWDDEAPSASPSGVFDSSYLASDLELSEVPQRVTPANKDSVLRSRFVCEISGWPFAISEQELRLYRMLNVAAPSRCFEQRHLDRVSVLSGRKLYERTDKFGSKFLTAFSPTIDRPVLSRKAWEKQR